MPRFSIKDLMLATMAVAVGIAALLLARDDTKSALGASPAALGLWVIGWSSVGAGFLYPFGRGRLGWIFGFVVSILWIAFQILAYSV